MGYPEPPSKSAATKAGPQEVRGEPGPCRSEARGGARKELFLDYLTSFDDTSIIPPMATLTRKERELQQREERILAIARPLLVQDGYHGLNMDRVAAALEYSKGTVYNHFSCKEEIIIALAIETTEKRTGMFQRAAAFQGNSRQRIHAVGTAAELFVRLYPDHFKLDHIIRSESIWQKTSEKRRAVMRSCESRCIAVLGGIVRDAIAQNDLRLPDNFTPEDLVFALWSISFGAFSIITSSDQLVDLGIQDPFGAYRESINRLIDGFGWQPLSTEYDQEGTLARIQKEVFADEFQLLAA